MGFSSRNEKFRAKSSKNTTPVGSLLLDLPPSCLEFVPVSNDTTRAAEQRLFVVGTYDLQREDQDGLEKDEDSDSVPKEQSRQGSLSIFGLKNDNLTLLQTHPTPSAILDLHFYKNTSLFAVASSTGTISIFRVQSFSIVDDTTTEWEHSLIPIITHQVLEEDEIITSFAWDASCEGDRPVMSITSNTGAVMVLAFDKKFTKWEFVGDVFNQHAFEAWCCAFSEKGETLFSGGDDSKLIMSSLDTDESSSRKLPFHNAGVTAILPIPASFPSQDTSILLTGSYDDYIRVYQLPTPTNSKPKILAEKDIGLGGGGVWRLKSLDSISTPLDTENEEEEANYRILATCMRVGCKILDIAKSKAGEWTIEVIAQTGIHESMNYASDFVPLPCGDMKWGRTIVSTSFYDRLLFVWKYDPDVEGVEI